MKGRKLVEFLRWALTEGEKRAAALDYAPLPEQMTQQLLARVNGISVGGAATSAGLP